MNFFDILQTMVELNSSWVLRPCFQRCSTNWCQQIPFTAFWLFVCITSFYPNLSVIWHRYVQIMIVLENYRYQTNKRNITKCYQLIPKQLMIQNATLQRDTLNINTTFCNPNSISRWGLCLSNMFQADDAKNSNIASKVLIVSILSYPYGYFMYSVS